MKVGDLVRCLDQGPQGQHLGIVIDVFEDDSMDYSMYEVICTDPFYRGWFSPFEIKLINPKERS